MDISTTKSNWLQKLNDVRNYLTEAYSKLKWLRNHRACKFEFVGPVVFLCFFQNFPNFCVRD